MKSLLSTVMLVILMYGCEPGTSKNITGKPGENLPNNTAKLIGTWKLIKATLVEKGDTTITDYTKNISFIKIINDTHFAFLQHDLDKGKDPTSAVFVAGGGRYTLQENSYTEKLEYCSARNWEGNDFSFTLEIEEDTLTQTGTEIIESEGINRLNIERYIRVR